MIRLRLWLARRLLPPTYRIVRIDNVYQGAPTTNTDAVYAVMDGVRRHG